MNFQGRLARPDGTPVSDGSYTIRFSLWDSVSGGTERWNQTASNVHVRNGTFSVLLDLGTGTDTVLNNTVYLEIKIGTDAALTPRQQITSVAFAMKANTVPDNTIASAKIVDNAVTSAKIANSAVTNTKIAADAVDAPRLKSDTGSLNKVAGGLMTATNARIGISTSAPGFTLDVNGTFRAVNTAQLDKGFFSGGDAVIGSTGAIPNPFQFSRVLAIQGSSSGTFPNTAGLAIMDSTGSVGWSAGLTNDGNFTFVKSGGGSARVVVPVLQVNGGSDVAEPFPVRSVREVQSGMVVCIDPGKTGALRLADHAYDKTVAGIVSGAGGIRPGMTLSQTGTVADGSYPVALTGRVWCYADADAGGAITPGDLLTTSRTPGHAMKATNFRRTQGAVLGKAMSSLKKGKGLVLVLVGMH